MGSTPAWLTLLVAILGPVTTAAATLGAQWLAGVRAVKLAVVERDRRRDERIDHRLEDARRRREESYATLLAAVRQLRSTVRTVGSSADTFEALNALRQAASYVELRSPAIADGPLVATVAAAERLVALPSVDTPRPAVVAEVEAEYDRAVAALRQAMRADVGTEASP